MSKGKTTSDKIRQELQSLCDEMFAGWQHFDIEEAECRFVKRIIVSRRRHRLFRLYAWSAVAASLLVVIGMALAWHSEAVSPGPEPIASETRMKAPSGCDLVIRLPDNSRVRLRSGSSLVFSRGFGRSHRQLALDGQAVFEIKHRNDMPMRIHTPHLVVTDLGTVFKVSDKATGRNASVTLYSGKASVQGNRPMARPYMLKPHESITINTEGELVAWTRPTVQPKARNEDNELFFENARLEDIARRLSKVYSVNICVAPRIRDQRFDGYFNSKDDKLTDILDALSQSEGLHCTIEGRNYLIH